ncbi:MAG: sporulation protein YabP [Clostridia bacterium]|nr:sporulation protein YabP [Clostridia bacterium]
MNEQTIAHDITIKSRGHMELSGVENVVSFDEETVCLETVMGEMIIEGEELHVSALNTEKGTVLLLGKINGLYYNTVKSESKKSFFGKLFG